MDCFAVSLAIGTSGQIPDLRGKLRLAAHFGIFQAGMTALGWILAAASSSMWPPGTIGLPSPF